MVTAGWVAQQTCSYPRVARRDFFRVLHVHLLQVRCLVGAGDGAKSHTWCDVSIFKWGTRAAVLRSRQVKDADSSAHVSGISRTFVAHAISPAVSLEVTLERFLGIQCRGRRDHWICLAVPVVSVCATGDIST